MVYYLPATTAQLVEKRVGMCKNLGLLLDKYPPREAIQESKEKGAWLKRLIPEEHFDAELARSAYDRWAEMTNAMGARRFRATLDWRMVVGLGGETVLETDLTLHHLYGIPYIPGSALKGLTRAFAAEEDKRMYIPENKPEDQRSPSQDVDDDPKLIKQIFGTQQEAGTVLFFDAMPVDGKAKFALDIMNAHYPNYYGEKKLPTNDQSPNPVTFLTVAETTFEFALAPRRSRDEKYVEQAEKWLRLALEKYGVGGKTSAGYGYFTMYQPQPPLPEDAYVSREPESLPLSELEKQPESAKWTRPAISLPAENQVIQGVVIAATEDLRRKCSSESAGTFLRYKTYQTRDIFIVISVEHPEVQNWQVGNTRNCQVMQVEERDNCIVLVCKPVQSKFGDKKKRK